MDKIDIHNSEEEYEKAVELLKSQLSKKNSDLIIGYLNASAIGKTARKNASTKQVGIRARLKNLYLLKIATFYFDKTLIDITEKEMETFIRALNENKLKKQNGEKYSEQTKANIKKTLIIFLRFHLGETEKYHKLTDWIETRFKKKEIPALTEDEVRKILNKCNTLQQKVLISLLFDSGCRIEEFLNIRIEDIVEVKGDVPYYRLTVRGEFSKTVGRTIGLLWKETTPIIREWLDEHPNKNDLSAPLFPSTYDGVRKVLAKLGKRALRKPVNPHLFRHTSATYYAGKGIDYFQLCKRYGWSIGSSVPHIYIDRAGIKENEIVEKVKSERFEEMTMQVDKLREENKMIREQLSDVIRAVTPNLSQPTSIPYNNQTATLSVSGLSYQEQFIPFLPMQPTQKKEKKTDIEL